MRLTVIKGMGFEPVTDKSGRVVKVLISTYSTFCYVCIFKTLSIESASGGNVHVVDLTTGKSQTEYREMMWKLACS